VTLCAIAVSGEGIAGGRVVAAPTKGAANMVAVGLRYSADFCAPRSGRSVDDEAAASLLAAGAVCALFKSNALISDAEVGCQGRDRLGVRGGHGADRAVGRRRAPRLAGLVDPHHAGDWPGHEAQSQGDLMRRAADGGPWRAQSNAESGDRPASTGGGLVSAVEALPSVWLRPPHVD